MSVAYDSVAAAMRAAERKLAEVKEILDCVDAGCTSGTGELPSEEVRASVAVLRRLVKRARYAAAGAEHAAITASDREAREVASCIGCNEETGPQPECPRCGRVCYT